MRMILTKKLPHKSGKDILSTRWTHLSVGVQEIFSKEGNVISPKEHNNSLAKDPNKTNMDEMPDKEFNRMLS